MNSELEERILYVLSALEDANEALDKCDRLMTSKRSEATLKAQQDKQDDSKQVVAVARIPKTQPEEKQEVGREAGKKGQRLHRGSNDRKPKQPVLPKEVMQKTKAVQTECSFTTTTNTLMAQIPQNAQDIRTVAVVKGGQKQHLVASDPDFGKVLKKIQTNNDRQWKHVRKFIRTVLLNELEQEKWSRQSTEDLNIRLAKQNQQLRSKLQEKREERKKIDERMKGMKSKYKEKSRTLNQNQQVVVSRCQETFEKLSKLHNDLEGIQQQLVMDTERFDGDSPVKGSSPTRDLGTLRLNLNPEDLPSDMNEMIQTLSKMQEQALREEILKEYYPMIVESRIVMESLLSSIGHRISRLIEMNTRASINHMQSRPPNNNYHEYVEKIEEDSSVDDSPLNEDLLYLFSKEFEAAADFWKAKSYKTYKRLQEIKVNCQKEIPS